METHEMPKKTALPENLTDAAQVFANEVAHDRIARFYPFVHPEIYNPTEQIRLRETLSQAIAALESADSRVIPNALDVGAGRGNLTTHLLSCGCAVTAADVSRDCLRWIERDLRPAYGDRLTTSHLNGMDMSQFDDDSFDFVGCYSVLHHVPNYLGLLSEMARVTRRGGMIYIDHEASEGAWDPTPELIAYREDLARAYPTRIYSRALSMPLNLFGWYLRRALLSRWRKLWNPRYSIEGDIHIWPDQRVEWTKIEDLLRDAGFERVRIDSYLGCREPTLPAPIFEQHRRRCADVSVLMATKGRGA